MTTPPLTTGSTPLSAILAQTALLVHPDDFVLVGLPPADRPRLETDLRHIRSDFYQLILEPDVLTLLTDTDSWASLSRRYPAAQVQGPLALFTFSTAMDWDVVGFLAAVTGVLAQAGIPLGAVCGYYRDHLFIAVEYADKAEAVLRAEFDRARIVFNRDNKPDLRPGSGTYL